jgi:hypothetical protein
VVAKDLLFVAKDLLFVAQDLLFVAKDLLSSYLLPQSPHAGADIGYEEVPVRVIGRPDRRHRVAGGHDLRAERDAAPVG